jgi:hypothetical protein
MFDVLYHELLRDHCFRRHGGAAGRNAKRKHDAN